MAPSSLVATGLLALSGLQSGSKPTQLDLSSRADTSGCGITHWFNGITQYHSVDSGGRSRDYSIHLPGDYDKDHQYPLVLGFHGSDSVGFFFEVDTKLSESRFSGDKIIVYPTGFNGSWAGPSYATLTVEEDLQFIGDLLVELRKNYCIDSSRIYGTGMSNGGGFIGDLACNEPVGGQFAAFASSSGSFYTDTNGPDNGCKPARIPVPIIEFHGGSDQSVHYEGGQGQGGIEPSIREWLGYWAVRNGCSDTPEQVDTFNGQVHYLTWSCGGLKAVQHYKVDDMGHVWPSTEPNFSQIAAGEGPTHIQASSIIMDFFNNFTLPT